METVVVLTMDLRVIVRLDLKEPIVILRISVITLTAIMEHVKVEITMLNASVPRDTLVTNVKCSIIAAAVHVNIMARVKTEHLIITVYARMALLGLIVKTKILVSIKTVVTMGDVRLPTTINTSVFAIRNLLERIVKYHLQIRRQLAHKLNLQMLLAMPLQQIYPLQFLLKSQRKYQLLL